MVWVQDFVGKDGDLVWVDGDRFVHLLPSSDGRWIVRLGLKSDSRFNQQSVFKNRSRAMTSVRNVLSSRSWRLS